MSNLVKLEGGSLTMNYTIDKRFTAESELERNVSTQSSEYVKYAPIGGINNNQVEFQVEPQVGYIDLKNSYIHSQIRPRKNGGDLVVGDLITTKAFTSLLQWSDIRTYINDVEVSDENSGLYPFSAFAKVALGESNVKQSTVVTTPGGNELLSVLSSNDTRNIEGVVCPDSGLLCGGTTSSMTASYQRRRNNVVVSGFNQYFDTKTCPKDGIWQQPEYLQPGLRIRLVLTKNDDNQLMENQTGGGAVITTDYKSINLYLKRVYPTPSMGTIAKQIQMEKGMLYTLVRARTAQVSYSNTQTNLDVTGLLAGQNPSIVVVGFYQTLTQAQQLGSHPFNSSRAIKSLYIRVGGMRIPENYDYERQDETQANSLIDYQEYLLACKANSHSTTISDNETPLLSYEAYKNFSFFVFNCKSNKETMWGRDDSSNSVGSVDIYARFTGGAESQNRMLVIGLGHDQVHIDHTGKVSRIGW